VHELEIRASAYGTKERITDNIRYALSLGLPELQPCPVSHDGTFIVCGSGPSIETHIEDIRKEALIRPICAVNGAHDFLVENGIKPALFLTVDPRPMEQNFKHVNDDTIYLIASRCDVSTFEVLKGRNILVWHAWGGAEENALYGNKLSYGGGTTSGLRALTIGYILGFRNFHLYGIDSCLMQMEKRVGEGEIHMAVETTDVIVGGTTFICTMAMAQQASAFQDSYDFLPGASYKSFGNGLITAIIAERRKLGFKT
jgi:hypothetical protein